NMGLFHAVTSYNGQIAVSFQACREMMPDPGFYEQCLYAAYAALQSEVLGKPRAKKTAQRKVRAKATSGAVSQAPGKAGVAAKANTKAKTKAKGKTKGKITATATAKTKAKSKAKAKATVPRAKTGGRGKAAVRPKLTALR